MSKLALPVAELLGSPLSSDELKSIVGGYHTWYECDCQCKKDDTTISNERWYDITTAEQCDKACTSYCIEGTGGTPFWVFETTTTPH